MGLNEPVVPPFPISDYGTGCMGAIAAMSGLYYRAKIGGSFHGKASLMQYDMLLIAAGKYPQEVQDKMRANLPPEFFQLRHCDSVDRISSTVLKIMQSRFPHLFVTPDEPTALIEKWHADAYNADIEVVRPVAQIAGVDNSFVRASRPNGTDQASWEGFRTDYNPQVAPPSAKAGDSQAMHTQTIRQIGVSIPDCPSGIYDELKA